MKWPLFEEASDDTGTGKKAGGGGDGGEAGDKGDSGKQDNSEILLRGLAVVAKGISDTQETNKQILEALKAQAAAKADGDGDSSGSGKGASTALFDGVDMEQLDRKDFAALLLSKFEERLQHHMKEAVKPLDERLGKVSERLEDDMANREVSAVAGQRPDFYEWRPEIAQIVKDNPGLSVTRAYTLARNENPDKAKKMDEKYRKEPEKKTASFVGLTPTGGGGRGEGATKMKFNEAAEKAYSDVLASLGGVSLDQLPVVGGKR